MSSIKIKSFFDHKRGVDYWDGADRSAMNLERGRFAVADGVSQSFLPNLWAEILCDSFVNGDAEAEEDWIARYSENQLATDCQLWKERSEDTLKNATEDEIFLLQNSQEEYRYAGSTLVGIAIKDNNVFYNVLGDSCLFVFDKETKTLASYSTINEQVGFTTAPDYFLSAGKVVGQWKHGFIPLKSGYIMLMTDALSEWLTKEYAENPSLLEQLWALDSHEAFMELVENARETDAMKDDDVALMMLQVEDGYEVLYCDTMESLAQQESAYEENNTVVPDNQEESVPESAETDSERDEISKEQGEVSGNDEEIIQPNSDSSTDIDEALDCCEEKEEPQHVDTDDGCFPDLFTDVPVTNPSQEEPPIPLDTTQPKQEQTSTEEDSDTETDALVIDHVNNEYCPRCGKRYVSDKSLFCAFCGHSRVVQWKCDNNLPTDNQ